MSQQRRDRFEENTEHSTGNPNLDPEPGADTDLEAGGGVSPGATPPESNSATATPQNRAPRKPPSSARAWVIGGVLVGGIVIFFLAYLLGLGW